MTGPETPPFIASERTSSRSCAIGRSPLWHAKQDAARMGLTSAAKSTGGAASRPVDGGGCCDAAYTADAINAATATEKNRTCFYGSGVRL
jgi:hypothetical protein